MYIARCVGICGYVFGRSWLGRASEIQHISSHCAGPAIHLQVAALRSGVRVLQFLSRRAYLFGSWGLDVNEYGAMKAEHQNCHLSLEIFLSYTSHMFLESSTIILFQLGFAPVIWQPIRVKPIWLELRVRLTCHASSMQKLLEHASAQKTEKNIMNRGKKDDIDYRRQLLP